MTAWVYLGLVIMAGVGMVGSYLKGVEHAEDRLKRQELEMDLAISKAINKSNDEVMNRVAKAIKSVRVENKTVVQNFKEVEKEHVVYRECVHADDAFRLLNDALQGGAIPTESDLQNKLPD